ncbi:MAG: hypothetical protein R2736_16975 [Solirubrobacterales bacterium]
MPADAKGLRPVIARLVPLLGAAAVLAGLPASAAAKTRTVDCDGSPQQCTATFPLAGLKSGDRLVARLPDTDLQLRAVVPSSRAVQAAIGFQGFSMRLGGSLFVAKLVVARRPPADARVSPSASPCRRACATCGDVRSGSPVRRSVSATCRPGDSGAAAPGASRADACPASGRAPAGGRCRSTAR